MAEKSFGVKEVNLIGASGTPTITSPNNLNLNAVNVAISTNATVGGTLSVTGNVSVGGTLTYEDVTNIDAVGVITARAGIDCNADLDVDGHTNLDNVSVAGVTTFAGSSYFTNQDNYFKHDNATVRFQRTSSATQQGAIIVGNSNFDIFTHSGGSGGFRVYTGGAYKLSLNSSGTLTATTFSGSGASLTNLPAANLTGTLPAISGANLTNLPADTPTNSDIQVVYTVTANGSSAYRFAGNGVVSTADNPDLYLIRGQKYRFINNSGGSHPFQIRETSGGTAYSTGVTNNGASSGNIDFAPANDSPAQLVYQCTSHGGMVGNIYLRDAAGGNTNVGVTTFSGGITVSGNTSFAGGNVTMTASGSPNSLNVSGTSRFEIASIENAEIDGEIAHSGDTDTKISFDTNTINLTAGGTTGLTVLDASVRVPTKLGINGVAPQTPLDVAANGSGYAINVRGRSSDNVGEIRFTSNDYGSLYSVLQTGATYLNFQVGSNTNALRIDSSGNFNLGLTGSPAQSTTEQGVFLAGANSTQSVISSNVTPFAINRMGTGGNDRNCIEFRNNGSLKGTVGAVGVNEGIFFQSGSTEVMRITSDYKVLVGMTTTGTTTSNNNLELASTKMLKVGSMYMGYVIGTGNNSNGVLILHKMGQNVGLQFSGMLTIHSYTGSAYLSGCIVVRYNTDAVTRELTLQKAQSGANFELVSGTISGESGTYFGIKKNGGGTGSFYINAFVGGNIESYGGIREVSNSNWTTSTTHFTVT